MNSWIQTVSGIMIDVYDMYDMNVTICVGCCPRPHAGCTRAHIAHTAHTYVCMYTVTKRTNSCMNINLLRGGYNYSGNAPLRVSTGHDACGFYSYHPTIVNNKRCLV